MRIAAVLATAFLSLALALGCNDDHKPGADADPFDTLQECFDEHHVTESLPVKESIVVCCTDHPIAGVHPSCGATQAACETHVRAELSATTTAAEIQTACADYIAKK